MPGRGSARGEDSPKCVRSGLNWKALAPLLVVCLGLAAGYPEPSRAGDTTDRNPGASSSLGPGQTSAPLRPVERSDDDLVILEVRLGSHVLSDGMIGFLHRGGLLLPLGEMMRALDFPIAVDPSSGQAQGWFLSEDRLFALDLAREQVVVYGELSVFDPTLVELHFDDIYVDTTLIARWFPVDIAFDLTRLVAEVTSREPLPLEEQLAREQVRARLLSRGLTRPQYPRVDLPYRLLDWPFVDTSMFLGYDGRADDRFTGRYNTLISGDLLYMDTRVFVAGDDEDGLRDLRLTTGRKDPDGDLLGPLGATEFAAGDVFTPQLPLVADQQEGRGGFISNFPLNRPSEFDRITLRGELPLGWEVELYRNEVLLEFQRSRADGRYEFIDVPLLYGSNVLRLLFFGPQAQRREEVQRIVIGPGMARPGENHYRLAANQQDVSTTTIGDDEGADEKVQGEGRFFGEYERGVTKDFSIGGSLASLPLEDGRHNYASLGLRAGLFGAFVRLDTSLDTESGKAVQGSLLANLFGIGAFLEHGQFFDYFSERAEELSDPLESRSNLRIDGIIPAWILPRVPFTIDNTLERFDSGRYELQVDNRLSMFFSGISVSNNLSYFRSAGGGTASASNLDGSFLPSLRLGRLGLRGQLDYRLDPATEFRSAAATAEYALDRDFEIRADVSRELADGRETRYSAGLNKAFEGFALGVEGTYSDEGYFSAGLTLSFGFGREPRTGRFAARPRSIATNGAASARVFLDNNQNQVFDAEDEPIEGVRLRGESVPSRAVTDADGVVFITDLTSYRPTDLTVDIESLEDPYWMPVREGVELVPRPGKSAVVDFPVSPTGEVDGTVFVRRGGGLQEVSNVRLQLVDEAGEVVRDARSEFDGFYLFQFVMPGSYRVRVSPEQAERLKLKVPASQAVSIEPHGNVVSGVDIILERLSPPEGSP